MVMTTAAVYTITAGAHRQTTEMRLEKNEMPICPPPPLSVLPYAILYRIV